MSREGDYLVYAIEQYRFAKGLSGREVMLLFERHAVSKFIIDMYELFHIERDENMISAVDDYIRQHGETPPPSIAA